MPMTRHEIGNAIQKARLAIPGLSQEDMAKAVGKSGQMGGNWERGANEPAPETKLALAALLNVDAESIGYAPPRDALHPALAQHDRDQLALMAARIEAMDRTIAAMDQNIRALCEHFNVTTETSTHA